jgi:hypothetical protein
MIFVALRAVLAANSGLTAIVPESRIYVLQAPAGSTYPDIIQYPASGTMEEGLDGTTPPWRRRISFEVRAQTYQRAHDVGDVLIAALNNYVGTMAGENLHGCHLVDDRADVDEASAIKRRIIDFRVTHSPA